MRLFLIISRDTVLMVFTFTSANLMFPAGRSTEKIWTSLRYRGGGSLVGERSEMSGDFFFHDLAGHDFEHGFEHVAVHSFLNFLQVVVILFLGHCLFSFLGWSSHITKIEANNGRLRHSRFYRSPFTLSASGLKCKMFVHATGILTRLAH